MRIDGSFGTNYPMKNVVVVVIAIVISVLAVMPMIRAGGMIDYDGRSTWDGVDLTHYDLDGRKGTDSFYGAVRKPGTPMFTLLTGFIVYLEKTFIPHWKMKDHIRSIQYLPIRGDSSCLDLFPVYF